MFEQQENIGKQEHYLELQYDDLMQLLVQRFEDRSQGLEEEKKLKLEKLYNMLVSCGHSMDGYKELMEATDVLFTTEDKPAFLKVISQAKMVSAVSRTLIRY